MSRHLSTLGFGFLLIAALRVHAETEAATPPAGSSLPAVTTPAPAPTPVVSPAPGGSQAGKPVESSLTLNFKEADIRAFISAVSELTHRNFVVDPRVQGKVTVISSSPTDPDDLYQVFLSILKVHGYTAIAKEGVTTIVPESLGKQEPSLTAGSQRRGEEMVTGVIPVHFVSAAELVPVLRPLLPQDSHLAATAGTNVLVVADSAGNVERMVQIVAKLDIDNSSGIDVIPLRNASATSVISTLEGLATKTQGSSPPPGGGNAMAFAADERTNSVLLAGAPQAKLRYRGIIASLDASQSEAEIIRVVTLHYANARDMTEVLQEAATGQSGGGGGGGHRGLSKTESKPIQGFPSRSGAAAGGSGLTGGSVGASPSSAAGAGSAGGGSGILSAVRITADEATNSLIVQGSPRDVAKALSVVEQLDVRRAQVLVEGIVAEVTDNKSDELGVQWKTNLPKNGLLGATQFKGSNSGAIDSPFSATDAANFLGGLTLGYFSGGDLRTLVRVLSGDAYTNVLSTPSLMTLDNAEAEIVVGQNVPFVTGQFTNAATTPDNPFQTIQRQDVGIKLRVKPQINEGDTVTMDIEQEVSSVNEGSTGANLITNKRSIKTSVQVDNGAIVVLGGLIGDDARANQDKIPLLGDVPLLGNFFKNSRRSAVKTNLMVFLRPQIVRDRAGSARLSKSRYEDLRKKQIEQNEHQTETLLPHRGLVLPEGIVE